MARAKTDAMAEIMAKLALADKMIQLVQDSGFGRRRRRTEKQPKPVVQKTRTTPASRPADEEEE